MKSLKEYITTHLANGKHFFSKQNALQELGLTASQFRFQAYRLSQKKIIQRLYKDFFMIIPQEYYHLGSLPSHWIINPLMNYLHQEDYYIALLSAASIYGATEQQPMVFQIITNKSIKPIQLERSTIEFHSLKSCSSSLITTIQTPTGLAKISTKEQTIVDLLRFYSASGHLNNVALVIKSLAPECSPVALAQVANNEKVTPLLQRLGYILEFANYPKLAKVIEHELLQRTAKYILLQPDFPINQGEKVPRWKLILNDTLELS